MKPIVCVLCLALAACSPPPETVSGPDPGGVQAISRAIINADGPYPARIEIKINYTPNYDDALNRGFWTGTVSPSGNSWTNRSFRGPSYSNAFICPALWVYLGKPLDGGGFATIAQVGALYPYSTTIGRGNWADAQTGDSIQQVKSCSYKVDNIGINRTDNVDYKLWVALDCDVGFGGYRSGLNPYLAEAVDYWSWDLHPATPPETGAPSPRYMIRQAGPGVYGAHPLWESVSYACQDTSRRIPDGGSVGNVVLCGASISTGFCVGWRDGGQLQW